MDDLISKYFREDLTEAEEKALAETLATHPDEAERLRAMAEAKYRQYGLPEPTRPPGLPPPGGSGMKGPLGAPWIMGLALVGILGGMVGTAVYMVRHRDEISTLSQVTPGAEPAPVENAGTRPSALPALASNESVARDSPGSTHPAQPPGAGSLGVGTASTARTHAAHGLTPQLASSIAPEDYSNLGVSVRQAIEGPVLVHVLDLSGAEKMVIYRGDLKAGEWVFNWDGHYPDGRSLEPGYYQVEVKSHSVTQSRRISISAP